MSRSRTNSEFKKQKRQQEQLEESKSESEEKFDDIAPQKTIIGYTDGKDKDHLESLKEESIELITEHEKSKENNSKKYRDGIIYIHGRSSDKTKSDKIYTILTSQYCI